VNVSLTIRNTCRDFFSGVKNLFLDARTSSQDGTLILGAPGFRTKA
jgi:hypothetical protein